MIRIAVAQLEGSSAVPTADELTATGTPIRSMMRRVSDLGARLVLFHEGALTYPHKRRMSIDPNQTAQSDWSKVDWAALERELEETRGLAGELGVWTVVHGLHRLTGTNRPHNSLYVISDAGELVTRYDKRLVSNTEVSFMYTPGTEPIVFEVDGYRFGCAICIEIVFPELFVDYCQLGVDCMLFSTSQSDNYPSLVEAHARLNSMWFAVAMGASGGETGQSGIVAPNGRWLARCEPGEGVAVADIDRHDPSLEAEVWGARWWRSTARNGDVLTAATRPTDPRSVDRTTF